MDYMVKVEGGGSASLIRSARTALRVIALVTLAAAVTACGGGGGGGDDGGGGGGGNPPPTGQVHATVRDQFNAPINSVAITASIGSTTRSSTTGADGTATVTQVPTGTVSVTATAEGLAGGDAQNVTVNANATTNVTFTLQRVTEATGGISRAGQEGGTSGGSTFTFHLRVIVIDQNFNPVPGLTASAFTLEDCTPAEEFPPRPNCVRFNSAGTDARYTVANDLPAGFQTVAPSGPVPYAAGLLFDSSSSISESDPTDARIFATKEFLNDVGSGNVVMLAAFADDTGALLPAPPLTYYPCEAAAPCTPPFTSAGNDLFPSLDSLATLEGGGTPLYDSMATSDGQLGMIISVDDNAPTTPANLRRAAVLFSDGKDIYCNPADGSGSFLACNQRRAQVVAEAGSRQVDIFTIGLSENVDSLAMAELALRNGGAYMFAERPSQLISIFGVLDRLLSDSLPSYEMVWTVNAVAGTDPPNPLIPGRALIGRLTVNPGTTPFTLPFVVQIQTP